MLLVLLDDDFNGLIALAAYVDAGGQVVCIDAYTLQVEVLDCRVVGINGNVVHAYLGNLDCDVVVSYVAARYRAQTQGSITEGLGVMVSCLPSMVTSAMSSS